MPLDDPGREVLHVVEADRRVGEDHPLGAGVGDVALVPEGHVLEPGLRVAAQDAGEAGDPLGGDRVALVRHRRGALLALAERLLDLADLGPLEVPDLGREALEAGAGDRDRREQLGVAVAGDDLRRRVLDAEPEPLHDRRLDRRRQRGVGADGAGELPEPGRGERALEPREVAVGLEGEAGEPEAEAGRLGVDPVGAADADRVAVLERPLDERVAVGARAGDDDLAGVARSGSPARCRARRRTSARSGSSGPPAPIEAETTSTKAATSWLVVRSRSSTASTVKLARSRQAAASAAGTTPASASASVTASSTSSQPSILRRCVQTAPISSRV